MATATATRPAPPQGSLSTLAGTGSLLRFHLRRTRLYLIFWFLGLVGTSYLIAAGFPELYPDAADRAEYGVTTNTGALRSMTGPEQYIDSYADSIGAMYAHQMLLWTGAMVAVMAILLVSRLTRADEETSRLEVIRSQPIGRRADLAAALLLAVVASTVIGLGITLSVMGMEGVDFGGALLYGLAHTAIGIVFAGITAVTAQLASYSSTANGMAFAALGAAVLFRAIGDAAGNAMSWLSPIGWSQQTFVFTDEQRWWPLALSAGFVVLLVWLAFTLVTHRDFGLGMMPGRPGRPEAKPGLQGIRSLTFRLTRGLLWSGIITMLLLGASYGSVLGSADDMLSGLSDTQMELIDQGGGSLEENFSATIAMIDGFFVAIFGLLVIGRARKEETGGRGELLAAAPVPRRGWPGSYLLSAAWVTCASLVVGGLFLALTGAASVGDGGFFGKLLVASLIQLPAVWVVVAFAFAALGWLPRAGWLRWLAWIYVFFVGYYGNLLEMPDWTKGVSPFEHVSNYPAEDISWGPLVVLTVIAATLTALGYIGVRRRDLHFS